MVMRDSWYRLLSLEHVVDRCYRVEPWLHVARFMVGMDGYGRSIAMVLVGTFSRERFRPVLGCV